MSRERERERRFLFKKFLVYLCLQNCIHRNIHRKERKKSLIILFSSYKNCFILVLVSIIIYKLYIFFLDNTLLHRKYKNYTQLGKIFYIYTFSFSIISIHLYLRQNELAQCVEIMLKNKGVRRTFFSFVFFIRNIFILE